MARFHRSIALGVSALLVASGATLATPLAASAASGLEAAKVLDLRFDDALTDSGPNRIGTSMLRGSAEYATGIDGRALSLTGDDAVGLGTGSVLQPQSLTVSFWYKPAGDMGTGEQVFAWSKGAYNTEGWYLTSEGPDTPLALSIGTAQNQPYKVGVKVSRSSFFTPGQWTHVVATYDKDSKAVTFYRNGERQTATVLNAVGDGGGASGVLNSESNTVKSLGFNGPQYSGAYVRGALDDYTLDSVAASTADVVSLTQSNDASFDPTAVAQKGLDSVTVPSTVSTSFAVPTATANGTDVSWTSSDPSVIAVSAGQATVVRPAGTDATVTLTASGSYGGSSARSKTFDVVVPKAGTSTSIYVDDTDLNEVLVEDPYLENSHTKMVDWLLTLDPKRFLYSFDQLAGIPTTAQPYGGWERPTGARFQGHFFGHFISALSQAYATETDAARKAQLLEKLTVAVDGLKAAQDAYARTNPGDAGYVAPFPVSYLPHGADGLIVPFYNLHKVLAGLLKAHEYAPAEVGDEALEVAGKFGSWLNAWGSRQANPGALLSTEYGGMNEALYELYSLTQNEDHKKAAQYFDEVSLFRDLAANRDVLGGKHANTTIPKLIGALKRYTVLTDNPVLYARLTQAEKDDLDMYRQAADNFWAMVVKDHSYVGGGNSYSEHFQAPGTLYQFATNGETGGYGENSTVEGCNEYNMLKLSRALFQVAPDVKYADYYENTYINTILASQNPETGMMTYFQPQTAGYAKVFGKKEDEFWCDHGTATESFTKLGDSIYFRKGSSIWVNMFRSSVFSSEPHNLKLTQTADVPNTDTVTFTVASLDGGALASGTTLRLRVPDWSQSPTLTLNGQSRDASQREGGYLVVPVSAGDSITYTLPARVTVDADTENPNWAAFRYGPVVLSTELNRTNVDSSYQAGILVRMSTADKSVSNNVLVPDVDAFRQNITDNLVRLPNGPDNNGRTVMKFGLKNVDEASAKLTFEPYYSMYNARYALYMNLIEPDSTEAQAMIKKSKEQQRIDEMTTDALTSFDNNNSEAGKNYRFDRSAVGVWRGEGYRDAQSAAGSFFQYDMAIDTSAAKNYLGVRYYGGDNGRTFDVLVNGKLLKNERITNAAGGDKWYVQYDEIPSSFFADTAVADRYRKDQSGKYVLDADGNKIPVVTVRFQSNGRSFVGGVYGVYTTTKTAFDTASALTGLRVDGATLAPQFDGSTTTYTVYAAKDATSVTFDADPAVPSGLVYANGILFDDTAPRLIALGADGTATLTLRAFAQDHATVTEYTVALKRDTEAPTSRAALSGRTITLSASDTGSGVAWTQYRLDGGAWTRYDAPVTLDDRAHTVEVRATDKAGNTGAASSVSVAAVSSSTPPVLSATGSARTVTAGQSVSPGAVIVKDSAGNNLVSVPVTFTVTGPARFTGGQTSVTVSSDAVGMTVAPLLTTTGAGRVSVSATAPRATAVSLPAVTVVTASAALTVDGSASAAKVSGKVQLTAVVKNTSAQTVTLQVRSPYGTKTFTSVAPGASVTAVFKTSLASIPDGSVTVTVSTATATNSSTSTYGAVR